MKALLFLAVLGVATAQFLPNFQLSNAVVSILAEDAKNTPSISAISNCNDMNFNHCQYSFNQNIGIDTSLNFKTGTQLFNTINNLMASNISEVLNVCNQRTQFYQCLGTSYYTCMSLYTVLQRNVDYVNGFDYVRTYMGLDYLCNAGFEDVINQFDCLSQVPTTDDYKHCMGSFNESVNPSTLCSSVDTTSQCLYSVYKSKCFDKGAGFYGCENFRYTFDQSCYGLRCNVV